MMHSFYVGYMYSTYIFSIWYILYTYIFYRWYIYSYFVVNFLFGDNAVNVQKSCKESTEFFLYTLYPASTDANVLHNYDYQN